MHELAKAAAASARLELKRHMADPAWRAKVHAKDIEANGKFAELHRIIAAGTPTLAQQGAEAFAKWAEKHPLNDPTAKP